MAQTAKPRPAVCAYAPCGVAFITTARGQRYCSNRCQRLESARRAVVVAARRKMLDPPPLAKGPAPARLLTKADLERRAAEIAAQATPGWRQCIGGEPEPLPAVATGGRG